MEMMLDQAPTAFFKFARIFGIARYHGVVPADAMFAAKITGALHEDCGPCTQLVVDMALEAGMPSDQIEHLLARLTLLRHRAASSGRADAASMG